MKRLAVATALGLGAALVTTGVGATAPASAETARMTDNANDGEMIWARVHYGADRVKVTIRWAEGDHAHDFDDIYLDTRPKNSGPEVSISVSAETDGWSTGLVDNWLRDGWQTTCGGKARYDHGYGRLRVSVPRACIKRPGHAQPARIRVAIADRFETDRAFDWLPAKRTFGRWVRWK